MTTGPIAFRYPRGNGVGVDMPERGALLEIGKGRILSEGTKVALLSFGTRLQDCLLAAEELDAAGLSTTVADARFAKPLDEDLIRRLARSHEVLITVEEGAIGGFASHVLHFLATRRPARQRPEGAAAGACPTSSPTRPSPKRCMPMPASTRRHRAHGVRRARASGAGRQQPESTAVRLTHTRLRFDIWRFAYRVPWPFLSAALLEIAPEAGRSRTDESDA